MFQKEITELNHERVCQIPSDNCHSGDWILESRVSPLTGDASRSVMVSRLAEREPKKAGDAASHCSLQSPSGFRELAPQPDQECLPFIHPFLLLRPLFAGAFSTAPYRGSVPAPPAHHGWLQETGDGSGDGWDELHVQRGPRMGTPLGGRLFVFFWKYIGAYRLLT